MKHDLRVAIRMLFVQHRGFALVSILTLALGIGANAAIFSVLDAVLLQPLPYPDADRIVVIHSDLPFSTDVGLPDMALLTSRAFTAIGVVTIGGLNAGGNQPERLRAASVSPGFFDVLGVPPILGRTFSVADVQQAQRTAVISNTLWRRRFGGDPAIVGRTIVLNGESFFVLGVMPARVDFPNATDVWIPYDVTIVATSIEHPFGVARLLPGVRPERAREAFIRGEEDWLARQGRVGGATRIRLLSLREFISGDIRPLLLLIVFAALLVLLVASINVANLLLGRMAARKHEFSLRRALGASHLQLVRQILVETLLLSTVAGGVAVVGASWMTSAIRLLVPPGYLVGEILITTRVLAADVLMTSAAVSFFVFVGSTFLRRSHGISQHSFAYTSKHSGRRAQSGLVIAEIAATLALLVASAAVVAKVQALLKTDLGMRGDRALVLTLHPYSGSLNPNEPRFNAWMINVRRLLRRLDEEIGALSGVEAVGTASQIFQPDPELAWWTWVQTDDRARPQIGERQAKVIRASRGFFAAIGLDFLAGRSFDANGVRSEAIVSERFTTLLGIRPEEIIGRHLTEGTFQFGRPPREIVGVVRDVRVEGPDAAFEPALYIPITDFPAQSIEIVVKSRSGTAGVANAVRNVISGIDPELPVHDTRTIEEIRETYLADRRFTMSMMLAFGALAFGLSIVGLYSVISYLVQLRTREIGIRIALGASAARVRGEVLASGALHAAGGIVVGILGAVASFRVATAYVHGLGEIDPATVAWLAAGITLVAAAASWGPARRATRINPVDALRAD